MEKEDKDMIYNFAVKVGFIVNDEVEIGNLYKKTKKDLLKIIYSWKGNYGKIYSLLEEYKGTILHLNNRIRFLENKLKVCEERLYKKNKSNITYADLHKKNTRSIGAIKRRYQVRKTQKIK